MPSLMSAKKKIAKIAAFYDPYKVSLNGFDSTYLDATQFREQLRRNLGVLVSDEELGALVFLFDQNGDGYVDSVEFINEFFRLGKQERKKFILNHKDEKERIALWQQSQKEKKAQRFKDFTKSNIATSWTPEEEKSAIVKLANVAFTYDPLKGGLSGFAVCTSVQPKEFKELMVSDLILPLGCCYCCVCRCCCCFSCCCCTCSCCCCC